MHITLTWTHLKNMQPCTGHILAKISYTKHTPHTHSRACCIAFCSVSHLHSRIFPVPIFKALYNSILCKSRLLRGKLWELGKCTCSCLRQPCNDLQGHNTELLFVLHRQLLSYRERERQHTTLSNIEGDFYVDRQTDRQVGRYCR